MSGTPSFELPAITLPIPDTDYRDLLTENSWIYEVELCIAVLLVLSFLISSLLNPYLVYFYHNNKLHNMGHIFYQVLSLSNFVSLLWYAPYYTWWISQSTIPQLTWIDGASSGVVLSCLLISSFTTVYLSSAKLLAIRYPFYVMTGRVKLLLKASLAGIVVAVVAFQSWGVVEMSAKCYNRVGNIFPLMVVAIDVTTLEVSCFNKVLMQAMALKKIGRREAAETPWRSLIKRPHVYVFFVNAIISLILSGMVVWEILKITKARKKQKKGELGKEKNAQKSGVVTTLLLNLGNILNAMFCAIDIFMTGDLSVRIISSIMTLIFFPMLLCSFNPLLIILRGSRLKDDMKGSLIRLRRFTKSLKDFSS